MQVTFLEDRSGIEQRLLATRDDCPQQLLTNSSQHQIETEIRNLPELCRLLDSVQTARDFLLETGGRTSEDLVLLLRRLHLYQGEGGLLSGGPLRGLKIFHVDHLIDFFWFVRAKRMIRNRQNVFEQVAIIERQNIAQTLIRSSPWPTALLWKRQWETCARKA